MPIRRLDDMDLKGKRVLIRQDLNAPVKDGKVTNDNRLSASLPTLNKVLDAGGRVMVMAHFGRPTPGEYDAKFSLETVAERLEELLGKPVRLVKDWIDGVEPKEGEVALLENVRFFEGEKKNDEELGKRMAALCDVYVNDAFGTAHRAHSSTHAVARFAPVACAGELMAAEVDALTKALKDPARPMVAIVGGAKVSGKLEVLDTLSKKVDQLIVGGGIANTFLAAEGKPVGKSLYEKDLVEEAKKLIQAAKDAGGEIPIPTDVVVGAELSATAKPTIKSVDQVAEDDMILDIGPDTAKRYADLLANAGTIVWNGPVGVFEYDQFGGGTVVVGNAVATSKAFSLAGGGDTVAAVEKYNLTEHVSYISTGGGSFLEFLEGKELPAIAILEERGK